MKKMLDEISNLDFKIDQEIIDDEVISKLIKDNNLKKDDIVKNYADFKEYLKNKDKYILKWNGMLELIVKKPELNVGLRYLFSEHFSKNMTINELKGIEQKEKSMPLGKCMELRNDGFFLNGNNGAGKTYFTVALANERYKEINKKTLFIFWPELIQNLKKFERESFKYLDQVKKAKYLIIDDLGQELISKWSRDDILNPIITFRLENKLNTIITSNYSIFELINLYTFSELESKKVKSLFIKLETLSKPVTINSKDLRKED